MNIKEEQAKMREKSQRQRLGQPHPRKLSAAVENRKLEVHHRKQLELRTKDFASGKEIAEAIGQIFD